MPRAIWRGSISFGLVTVPVGLYGATSDKAVRFHEIDEKTGSRIRHKRVSEKSGREVPKERIVSGYQTNGSRYVVLDKDELAAAQPERTHTIEVEDFVELADVDPLHIVRSYWVVPDDNVGAKRAYALLRDALDKSGKVGIGRFVLRTKEHLVAVRPLQNALVVHTMRFADEIVPASSVDGLPVRVKVEARELKAAAQLISSLTVDWKPERYKDTHRDALLKVIDRKRKGKEIVVEEPASDEEADVLDLMAALEESVKASKSRRTKRAHPRKRSA